VGQGWAKEPANAVATANKMAERAIMLDPRDAKVLALIGHVRAFLTHRVGEAIALHDRALAMNPNLAGAWGYSGIAYCYTGDLAEASRRMVRYKKLLPLDSKSFLFDTCFCYIALLEHDHTKAVMLGRQISGITPAFSASFKPYLAALGHLGWHDEAAVVRERLLAIEPHFTVSHLARSPFEKPEHRAHFAEGLLRAGIAE